MPKTDMSKLITTQLKSVVTDFSVGATNLDEATDQKETYWDNPNWLTNLGYLKEIPEYRNVRVGKQTQIQQQFLKV